MRILFLAILFALGLFQSFAGERFLVCTDGFVSAKDAGLVLPHEHIFTDLRGPEANGYGEATEAEVTSVMEPLLVAARQAGVSTMIECTTIGVGRNIPVIKALAQRTGMHIVVPTGVYGRANYAPKKYAAMSENELAHWMMEEIAIGIESTGVRAGFIKTASSEKELLPIEEKFLRASARASKQTGVTIASHTTSGAVARKQANILKYFEVPLNRFVWVHAQAEPDLEIHKELAKGGVYIELDSVGSSEAEDEKILQIIRTLVDAGFQDRILISQDAGWYNPGQQNGGKQRGYTSLATSFLPKLRKAGFDDAFIRKLTQQNPFEAFSTEIRHE